MILLKVKKTHSDDRFNNSNSAIDFKSGYYTLPPGKYVCGDFTFSLWALIPNQDTFYNRFLDIGNGENSDNIVIAYSQGSVNYKVLVHFYYDGGGPVDAIISPSPITFNTWDHYALTLRSNVSSLYINGSLVAS